MCLEITVLDPSSAVPASCLTAISSSLLLAYSFIFWAAIILQKRQSEVCDVAVELKNVQDQVRNHKTNAGQHTIDTHICLQSAYSVVTVWDVIHHLHNNETNPNSNPLTFIGLQSFSSRILGGVRMPWFALTPGCSLLARQTGKLKSSQFMIGNKKFLTCSCRSERQWHPGHVQNKL